MISKRIFILALALVLLLSSCGTPAEPQTPDTEETEETVKNVTLDPAVVTDVCLTWGEYVKAAEIMTRAEEWGLSYILAYCEDPTVMGLQRAIAATETVVGTLEALEMPEYDIPTDTLTTLADSGVDMSFVPLEYEVLSRSIENDKAVWQSTLRSLMTESFWEYGIEYVQGWASVRLEMQRLYAQFRADMTNAVLISLGETPEKSTWKSWLKKAPTLLGGDFVWRDDDDALSSEMSDILDEIEEKIVETASVTGILSANYEMFSEATESGDWSAVNAVAVDFADRFAPIPLPEWSITQVYSYKYDDATNSAAWTGVGDDLTVCPDGFIFQYAGITEDQFYDYVSFLSTLGINYYPAGSSAGEEGIDLVYLDHCTMSLKWNEDYASIYFYDNEPLLVPSWYLGYMLLQLTE